MKFFISFIIAVFVVALFILPAGAADSNQTLTLEWDQDAETYSVMTRWQLGVGTGPGAGYTVFIDIAKSAPLPSPPAEPDTYQGNAEIIYTGTPGQTVTKYLKLRACIGPDDTTDCGGWSNEISHAVDIPIGTPGNLKKVSAIISIRIVPKVKETVSNIEDDDNLAINTW
jgi:hypothetical protein